MNERGRGLSAGVLNSPLSQLPTDARLLGAGSAVQAKQSSPVRAASFSIPEEPSEKTFSHHQPLHSQPTGVLVTAVAGLAVRLPPG